MNFLIFDIESTGLPREEKDPFHYPDYWPRIVQISWILAEEDTIRDQADYIILPEGFKIPKSSTEIHGISHERALAEGKPILEVLNRFSDVISQADIIVGHNIKFDRNVVTAEFARAKLNAPILGLPYHCTMLGTTEICKIPSKGNRKGYKWPTLEELHTHLFEDSFENSHNAYADVHACFKCYLELRRQGYFQEMRMKPEPKENKFKKKWGNPYY